MRFAVPAAIALVVALAMPAFADDVADQLDEAKTAYAKHDLRAAQKAVNTASTLLREQRTEQWKAVLPKALDGWEAEDAEGVSAAAALLGGVMSVSRLYRHGNQTVNILIVSDSPVIAALGGVLSGLVIPENMKTLIVDGHKTTFTKSDNSYMTMVADKAMVTVKGAGGAGEDDVRAYFKAIKFAEIDTLLK